MSRERLCSVADVPEGEARRFDVGHQRIAVVNIGGTFYAIGDQCSHANVSLAEGDVHAEDCTLECWKHGSTFSLLTGEPTCLPATRPVPVFEVTVEGDDVMVKTP